MTNVRFCAILALVADRPQAWPRGNQLVFRGLNLGAASFIATFVFIGSGEDSWPFAHPTFCTASLMGLAAPFGIATFSRRLGGAAGGAAVGAATAASTS
jgi:hypothetical protein